MKFIQPYSNFINEAFLQRDKQKAIDLILQYMKSNLSVDLNPYDEIWNIQKENLFLKGYLYLSVGSDKALRFNWLEGDIRSELHSIDIWNKFVFDTNPEYTLLLGDNSVAKVLPQILKFWNNPQVYVNQTSQMTDESEIDDEEKRLKRLRNPERIQIQQKKIELLKAKLAIAERSSTESEGVNQLDDDLQIEVFKAIELYTTQVANGKSNSLIITGDSGVGKTQTVIDTMESLGKVEDQDYFMATGTATTAGLYELLFRYRHRLIVFDDCDSVFKDPNSINMLKGALDTYKKRTISKLTKGNTFDSVNMTDEDMETQHKESGQYPNKFAFVGQIIFVSNLDESEFDKAILSRSLHVDVRLTKEELFERMKEIMKKISPDVDSDKKLEALQYLTHICNTYPTKFDLNIRTLIHSINLRANNEGTMNLGSGEPQPIWKLLIKKYLVKNR